MPRSNVLLFLIPTAIWGSTWLAIKFQLGNVAPELSVAYRFALGCAILVAWCRWRGYPLRLPARDHKYLVAFGALMCCFNYVTIYWAEKYVASGLVAVVFSTIVFMSAVGMRLAFGDPLTWRILVAATLGVTGVALLFLPALLSARAGGAAAIGIGLSLLGTLSATLGNLVAVRNHKASLPTMPTMAWGMGYGAVTAAISGMFMGAPWTFEATPGYVLSLLYLSLLGSVVAFTTYLELLRRVGAARSSFVGVATPVIALVLSTFFEGYRWTLAGAAGIVLAVFGNWLALRAKR